MADLTPLDLSTLSNELRLAFYGALFSMSNADRDMDEAEDDRIFESLDLSDLDSESRTKILRLAIDPPPLERGLLAFRGESESLRRALMLNLIDVVLADGIIEPGEHVGLHEARQVLGLSRDVVSELHDIAHDAQSVENLSRPIQPA
ncbi:TerB family tellurite resistance protein [Rubricoccus marinus]|uniref:Uncharacterized protein n=1 Tax=Rubricoccus marinus TaxID=716817 RepID=A0A259U3R7_9BACT|nr:TerB family tellurite resistance protein [Rubricoccus marinus]OZC04497.1 hypothetical protein BSZ36_16850 [Rubricoccus marinus]